VGTFQVQQGGNWYKFWLRNEIPERDTPRIVLARDLNHLPDTPVTVRCVNEYQGARRTLLGPDPLNALPGQCAERSACERFLATCQSLEDRLKGLEEDTSFTEEIRFIQEVLAGWGELQEFLAP
jgi:hypothetical protein